MPDPQSARDIARGDLHLCCCGACGFVFNDAFDIRLLDYGDSYDNTQLHSSIFEGYVDGLVDRVLSRCADGPTRFVEVGCGKGAFLRKLIQRAGPGATGIGFDPTYVGPPEDLNGRLRFEKRFYDADAAGMPADVVVCRHVIEHVPGPLDLLTTIHGALADSPQAAVYFETPCVRWILEHRVVWDFFYEHCSLFTASSLGGVFNRAGFAVSATDHVFSGQYLWLEATPAAQPVAPDFDGSDMQELAAAFCNFEHAATDRWRQRIAEWQADGAVALWGAGAKGVTLANLVDPDRRLIDCIVDVNPAKQGHYLPGTGHPIIAPEALNARKVAVAAIMNPNYRDEIEALIRKHALTARPMDLMQGM